MGVLVMGLTVLSLCDGISCAQIALKRCGISVDKYYAAEIKDFAIETTQFHFPDTVQLGDVNNISYKNGILSNGQREFNTKIDLVCFGSPCQSFSIMMNTKGRIGLEDKKKSGLFLECYRILKEINPEFFFVENVGSIKKKDKDFISSKLLVDPIRINSKDYSAALRDRYYWTNIPYVPPLAQIQVAPSDIIEDDFYFPRKKFRAILRTGGGGYMDIKMPSSCFGEWKKKDLETVYIVPSKAIKNCLSFIIADLEE